MKKVYLASLFLAAISMTSCDKDKDPVTDTKPVEVPKPDTESYIKQVLTSEKWIWEYITKPDGTKTSIFPTMLSIRIFNSDGTGYYQMANMGQNSDKSEEMPQVATKVEFTYSLKNDTLTIKNPDGDIIEQKVEVDKNGNTKLFRKDGSIEFHRVKKS